MPAKGISGLPLDPAGSSPVAQEVVELDERGRITLPTTVMSAIGWLAKQETVVLIIYDELGRIVLLPWESYGETVLTRRRELIEDAGGGDAAALDDLLLLEDRYHRGRVARDRRLSLGLQGLLHLGLDGAVKPRVYIAGAVDRIVIMSKEYRDQRLRKGSVAVSDLP